MKKEYRPFEEARKFVHNLNLKNQKEWFEYCKSGNKPDDVPQDPYTKYKKQNKWTNWGDFLGTGSVYKKKFRNFKSARQFVRTLKLKNRTEWQEYSKSGNKPDDIPSYPNETYEKEWLGVGDWLGTGRTASQNMSYRSFNDAREFVHLLKLKNVDEWRSYCKTNNKPDDIPAVPPQTYKNKGWIGYSDWLGTGTISNTLRSKNFPSFNDAKNEVQKIAKKYNLKNQPDWIKAYREGKIPKHLPAKPWKTYSKKRK